MKETLKYITMVMAAGLLMACGQNFNEIYLEEPEVDNNVQSGDDPFSTPIPIYPTIYNSEANIMSRGGGPLDSWYTDSAHWINTRLKVFAFRTRNYKGGGANFASTSSDYCLLNGCSFGVQDNSAVTSFFDANGKPTKQYYHADPLSRWKFYAVNFDDAKATPHATASKLTYSLELDGTQDIMHSFAYHEDGELAAFEKRLSQMGRDNDLVRIFTDTRDKESNDLLYGSLVGSLGLHPKFNLNHLLSRFDVYVVGRKQGKENTYLRMFVNDVRIHAAKDVEVTVADDSWERESYKREVEAGTLLKVIGPNKTYNMSVLPRTMSNNTETNGAMPDCDFDKLWQDVLAQDPTLVDAHHVYTTKEEVLDTLCKSFLLPAQDRYEMELDLTYLFCSERNGQLYLDYINRSTMPAKFTVKLPNDAVFRPGKRYSIIVSVSFMEDVKIHVVQGNPWQWGGQIDVDSDKNE